MPLPFNAWPVNTLAILSAVVTANLVAAGHGLGYDTAAATATGAAGRFTATPDPTTGLPYPPLVIVGCTGAGVPVVITTAYPHGVSSRAGSCGGLSCVIAGVGGNLAANNIDSDPRSLLVGAPAGILAVPLTPTTLALYGQDMTPGSDTEGTLVPILGSGVYTSGGTVTPALTDGSILIGRDLIREHSAPPRIVFVPRGVPKWGQRQVSIANGQRRADRRSQVSRRAIRAELDMFDVHCWGAGGTPDPVLDLDVTRTLAHAIIDSAHALGVGSYETSAGSWDDEKERATQHIKLGHLFVFGLAIQTNVSDAARPFAPSTTVIQPETYMRDPSNGALEQGCGG